MVKLIAQRTEGGGSGVRASTEPGARRSEVRPIEEIDDELLATPIVPSVLVVDDHIANLLALEGLLEPLGVRVVRASSGEEALKRLLTEDFALILMDVQMPGIDGIEAATMIKERERTRHIPIIFLTAISKDAAHVFRGYEEGAVDYLFKPFEPQILRMKVSVFVELYKRGETIKRQEAMLRRRERERMEAEAAKRSRELLDAMLDGVMLVDPVSLRFLYVNEGAMRHLGRTDEELAGMSLVDVQTLDVEQLRTMVKELVEARAEAHQYATELRTAGGATIPVDVVLQRIGTNGHGQLVAVVRDVTERVRTEDELRRANEAKDEFLAAASHELRTPLAAAKAQLQLGLRRMRDQPDEGPKRSLNITSQQIDRMTKLVEDLLDVSRIESGRLSLQLARFDLAASVREICDRMQPLTADHRIAVEAPAALEVTGDRDRLEQVLNNLLSNAIRYSPKGGAIEVTLTTGEGGATLSVQDHGVGVPKDKQDVIFERFGRAHGSRYGGLGLGLTISAGIVHQHGGTIEVESSGVDGEGSTFKVRLPIAGG